jgi:hypothetical protein
MRLRDSTIRATLASTAKRASNDDWKTFEPRVGIAFDPFADGVYIPGNCVAGQYGLAVAGPCSNTTNVNARRVLNMANPVAAAVISNVTAYDSGATANYNSAEHRNYSRPFPLVYQKMQLVAALVGHLK